MLFAALIPRASLRWSSKEAHYIIGVARRKKIIDIAVGKVSLHQDS